MPDPHPRPEVETLVSEMRDGDVAYAKFGAVLNRHEIFDARVIARKTSTNVVRLERQDGRIVASMDPADLAVLEDSFAAEYKRQERRSRHSFDSRTFYASQLQALRRDAKALCRGTEVSVVDITGRAIAHGDDLSV